MVSKRPFFTTRTRSWSPTKIRFQSMLHLQRIELQNPELRSAIASRSEVISRPAIPFGALCGAPSPDAERHFPPPHKAIQLPPPARSVLRRERGRTAGWSEIPSTGLLDWIDNGIRTRGQQIKRLLLLPLSYVAGIGR